MRDVFTVASILLCCMSHATSDPCDVSPAAEGESYTFKKRILADRLTSDQTLRWTYEGENYISRNTTILECTIGQSNNQSCKMIYDSNNDDHDSHHHYYSGHLIYHVEAKYYEASVQIASVNRARDEKTWWWGTGDVVLGGCELKAYSFRKGLQCNPVKTRGSVKMTCEVNEVYPEIQCKFSYKKTDETTTQSHSIPKEYTFHKKTIYSKGTNVEYYDYTCVLDLPFDQLLLGPGSYDFKMKTSMNLSSLQCNEIIHKYISRKYTFVFPEPKLMNCSNKTYINGSSSTCQCGLRVKGDPPGIATWSHNNHVEDDGERGFTDALYVTYNSSDPNKTYTCEGRSDFGQGTSVLYTPKFAFGPSHISISIHDLQPNVSHENKETLRPFYVYCNVSVYNAHPKPNVEVIVGTLTSSTPPQTTETSRDHYRYRFRIVPSKAGRHKVTCQATNPIFNDLMTKNTKDIEIYDDGSIEVSESDSSDENSGSNEKDSSDSSESEDGDKDSTSSDGEDGDSALSTAGAVGIGLAAGCVLCILGVFIFYKVRRQVRGSWERKRTLPNLKAGAHQTPSTPQPPPTHTRINSHHNQGGTRTAPQNSYQNATLQGLSLGEIGTTTMTSFPGSVSLSPMEEEDPYLYAELDDVLSEGMDSNQSNYDNQSQPNHDYNLYEVAVPFSSDGNPDSRNTPVTPRIVNENSYMTVMPETL